MKKNNLEIIKNKEDILAIIIYKNYSSPGVNFFSPVDFPQQIGFIAHKTGKVIESHTHKIIKREISLTQEVLIIKKGMIRVDFYDSKRKFFASRILKTGDVILLSGIGGHGYKVLNDIRMIEIKQGPYLGKNDKVRFNSIKKQKI